ncbi:MAG: phosphoserine phosphatase RsbU/P, partial [Humisphaera sp.]|nr:phosphoserine phosphatase RsbU/P [Humisphaera sp.]
MSQRATTNEMSEFAGGAVGGGAGTGAVAASTVISPAQLRLVLDVTRSLVVTTDLDTLLKYIAEATCELLQCERSSIFLHDPIRRQLWTKVALQTSEIRVPDTAGIVGAAFTENQVLHVPAPYDDPRFNREVDKKTGFVTRNILSAPMSDIERRPTGVLQAINKRNGAFEPSDVALIQLLADQAGVALQRYELQKAAVGAEAMRHEIELARRVQQMMLPKEMPDVPGIEAMGWTRSASQTCGDCFDLWRTEDGRLGILLADACGHGVAPMLVVSQVRTLVRAFSDIDANPRKLLARANARLAADLASDQFVTAFVAFLAPDGTLEWCSAGHGPILIRCAADAKVTELVPGELPLGVMPELTGEEAPPASLQRTGSLAVV